MSEHYKIPLSNAEYESQDFKPSESQFHFIRFPLQHSQYESQNFRLNGIERVDLSASTYETGSS